MVSVTRYTVLAVASIALIAATHGACSSKSGAAPKKSANAKQAVAVAPKKDMPRVTITPAGSAPVTVEVEVAADSASRAQGLMHRRSLGADKGMIFVFEKPEHAAFWMKNTYIPLDMIFINSDRRVVGVVENAEPHTETRREVSGISQFVLEVNAGFARKHGIGSGAMVAFDGFSVPEKNANDNVFGEKGELMRSPTSKDPKNGHFTLADATHGLAKGKHLIATIETSKGAIHCTLDEEKSPNTVANFVGLARGLRPFWDSKKGQWATGPFYDGSSFHRVIPGFMIQGGDPLGDGTGEVGYVIDDEIHPSHKHDKAGLLCMANRGPNTNGGQFFITDASAPHLDGGYTIFGTCEPVSVISEIARVPQSGAPRNRPNETVHITRVTVTRK